MKAIMRKLHVDMYTVDYYAMYIVIVAIINIVFICISRSMECVKDRNLVNYINAQHRF